LMAPKRTTTRHGSCGPPPPQEKDRSRHETRTTTVAPAPAELKRKWTGLQTLGQNCRRRELPDGTEQIDLRTSSAAWLQG